MLAGFNQKLEEIKQARQEDWKPVRDIEKEIQSLNSKFQDMDGFMEELGLKEGKKKNAYSIRTFEQEQQLRQQHPIWGTDCIDTAMDILRSQNRTAGTPLLKNLQKISRENKDSQIQYQAAMMLFLLCDKQLKNSKEPNDKESKLLLDEAAEILVKAGDADLIYAQWGKTIYEGCVIALADETTKELCYNLCVQAYDKFENVQTNIEGIEKYMDFVRGNELNEVELLIESRKNKLNHPNGMLYKLKTDQTDASRAIIRSYRSQILKTALEMLGAKGEDVSREKAGFLACADTFSLSVESLFESHRKLVLTYYIKENEKDIDEFIWNQSYLKVLPTDYKKCVSAGKYEDDLKEDLCRNVKAYGPNCIEEEWIYERTKEYVEHNKAKFETWLEEAIKISCVENYQERIKEKIRYAVKEIPKYGVDYKDMADYQFDLYKRCIDDAHCKEIQQEAWKKRWLGTVPDTVIDTCYKKEKRIFDAELKAENKGIVTNNISDVVRNFISNHKFISFIISMQLLGGALILVMSVAAAFDSDQFSVTTTMSDEASWEKREKEIDKIEAELSPTATPVSDFTYEEVDYVGGGKVIEIISYNGTAEEVEIPAIIDDKNVGYIRDGAFKDNMFLKRIVMPDTIVGIRNGVFENCTALEEVVFSKNLSWIGASAFNNCTSLTSVQIESGELSSLHTIESSAFAGCTALETVNIQTDIYQKLSLIYNSFCNCTALKEININGENLQSVVVESKAFENCTSLTSISFTDKITTLGEGTFKGCTSLAGISLPNITNIPKEAFRDCTALSTFHVSNTVAGIEDSAFRDCTNLMTVTFDEQTFEGDEEGNYIRDHAFAYSGLTEIELPGYYENVGSWAFRGTPMTKFVWHAGKGINQFLSSNAFGDCNSLRELYLPKTIKEIGDTQDIFYSSTIYAAEGGIAYKYAMENNYPWSEWNE